ncbi:MAG: hypothetical protein AUG51_01540 [Acidobacteria bacterium 13_1_20CM_3_53_8]|nr:MAG: hypothetical protein AUG51_01540 [Acidobacteria bacterium 13_1_20CM_3_53_8]
MSRKRELIRASEVGEYVFCSRAWWLRAEGFEPTAGHEARERGTRWHLAHGREVARARRLRQMALFFILLALMLATFLLLVWWRV